MKVFTVIIQEAEHAILYDGDEKDMVSAALLLAIEAAKILSVNHNKSYDETLNIVCASILEGGKTITAPIQCETESS